MWKNLKDWFFLLSFIVKDNKITDITLHNDGWVYKKSPYTGRYQFCLNQLKDFKNDYEVYLEEVNRDKKGSTYSVRFDENNTIFKVENRYELYKLIQSVTQYSKR